MEPLAEQLNQTAAHTLLERLNNSGHIFNAFLGRFEFSSLIACTYCSEYILTPIMQCPNGHLFCISCRLRIRNCPACTVEVGSIRNLAMEKVAARMLFPCRYYHRGCNVSLTYGEKLRHDLSCGLREYICPIVRTPCGWSGPLSQLQQHLRSGHVDMALHEGGAELAVAANTETAPTMEWLLYQTCYGNNFLLQLKKLRRCQNYCQFVATIKMLGTTLEAANFRYRLELKGRGRLVVWEGQSRSVQADLMDNVYNPVGVVFDSFQENFYCEDGRLEINVKIDKL